MATSIFEQLEFSIDPSLFLRQASQLPLPIRVIQTNHTEKINCLAKIPEGFVSGKKLQMWNKVGTSVQSLKPSRCSKRCRGYWVNTLHPSTDGWASGTCDGWINFWDIKGKEISSRPIKDRHIVHCISGDLKNTYVGIGKAVYACAKARFYPRNNEIHCIDVLDERSLVVGCGPDLEIWSGRDLKSRTFGFCSSFSSQICAFSRLESDSNYRAVGFSDGSLRIVDLNRPETIQPFTEHSSKIYSIMNLSASHFATCSDDKTIKIWDLREKESVRTLNPVRATALLKLDDTQFISARKGQIAFWDTRMV